MSWLSLEVFSPAPARRAGLRRALAALVLCAPLATVAEPAGPQRADAAACATPSGWDAGCLRRAYAGASARWPAPSVDGGVAWSEMAPPPPVPEQPQALVELGQRLFFDPRLSNKGGVSCASCHQPDKAFGDGRALAVGEDGLQGRRRSMPLLAAPFASRLFWDGRAASLEEQVLMPLSDTREMNHALPAVLARLSELSDYAPLAKAGFGRERLGPTELAQALAAYVRTIRPEPTRFDRLVAGGDGGYGDDEIVGLHLFRTKARCMNCHHGAMLTDDRFHDLGLSMYGRRGQDLGRFEFTRDPADLGGFRTPSLRNVDRAGPWMHNGLFPNLDGLLRIYNVGMGTIAAPPGDAAAPKKSPLIRKLELSNDELRALAAFLKTL